MNKVFLTFILFLLAGGITAQERKMWTLKACIDHALKNNLQLQKKRVSQQESETDIKSAKAVLFPSLSASITQGLNYRPFQESSGNFVNGGMTTSSSNKVTESGSYGLNASWTVWNGGKNTKNIALQKLNQQISGLSTEESANSIQEQIAKIYVQILYAEEAVKVNAELLKSDETIYQRGEEMLRQGQISKSDLTQLEAQVTSGQYDLVNSQTVIAGYKLQLKQLLELNNTDEFDVEPVNITDETALKSIPNKLEIYYAALSKRPEIKSGELSIEAAKVNQKIAKASYMPTVSLTAGIGDNHMTGTNTNFLNQMKNNLSGTLGVTVSIPIFDNRQNKSNVEKATYQRLNSELDLQEKQKTLFSSVETYWLDATSNQQKYLAAKTNVKSCQSSYEQMNEQFKLGLKNIVELLESRNKLLSAQQEKLQSKYTTLLNMQLLSFYGGNSINL